MKTRSRVLEIGGNYLSLNSIHQIMIMDGFGDVKHQNHLDMLDQESVVGIRIDSAE